MQVVIPLKITRQGSINPFEIYQRQQGQIKKAETSGFSATNISKEDTLELSTDVKKIGEYTKKLTDLPEIRESLVREIKEQMQAGTYSIFPEQLAESLLAAMSKEK